MSLPGRAGRREADGGLGRRVARAWLSLTVVTGAVAASATAKTASEVFALLDANATGLSTLECVVRMSGTNRGAGWVVLQQMDEQRHYWCDRKAQQVRERFEDHSGRQRVWDGIGKHLREWQGKGPVTVSPFPPTLSAIADTWPWPGEVFYPAELRDRYVWKVATEAGANVMLVGEVQGVSTPAQASGRVEVDVDTTRGVMTQLRLLRGDGGLVERIRFKRYQKVGQAWVPSVIKDRRNRERNVIDLTFTFTVVKGNTVFPASTWVLP